MGIARKKKKKTLKAKMLGILTMCAMTSLLAAVIVSYMELRMIQNDSIEDNMKMYLDQITKNTDEAYYDMISIVNYMGPGGLIGNVTDSYLDAVDNFDRFVEQRSLRQELLGLGYVNTKLVGATYYDKEEKKELISGMNVRTLDGRQNALPKVVKCAGTELRKWCKKIVHIHGKDATIDWDAVRHSGISGAVPFVWHRMPGFGDTNWRDIISILRSNGYEDDICIEGYHDPVYSGELEMTGQLHALNYLKWCRGGDFTPTPWAK